MKRTGRTRSIHAEWLGRAVLLEGDSHPLVRQGSRSIEIRPIAVDCAVPGAATGHSRTPDTRPGICRSGIEIFPTEFVIKILVSRDPGFDDASAAGGIPQIHYPSSVRRQ